MRSLIDPLGRRITYARVSLTEQCNLRCGYCYDSAKGHPSGSDQLSLSDTVRLIRALAAVGITKIRFTGGEPLVRPGIVDLIRHASRIKGIHTIALTTNGLVLEPMLPELVKAGLNRLNISLDTLDRAVFKRITGVDGFDRVYSAIVSAEQSGAFERVKVNTVIMRGSSDGEVRRFALWALARKVDLRFIEFMPAQGSKWGRALFVGEDEIKSRIGLDLIPQSMEGDDAGPATSYSVTGATGRISFISAVSQCFCGSCNRVRITSTGQLMGCLFLNNGSDLTELLADGAGTDEIARHIRTVVSSPGFRRMPRETHIRTFNPFMRRVGG
ncbi:MAG: GTP 3',8-cyclase MoaA [Candidatus Zixiibacteriota bacterium]|nr:MAG: GTP 3',8-cyclase MoaA [candidate division Zixibacteria bacterium]